MNKLPHLPVIEWSPQGCRIVDPTTKAIVVADTAASCLSAAGNPRQVILALARRQTFIKSVPLPEISKAEALNILQFQIDDVFPIETSDLSYDIEQSNLKTSDGQLTAVTAVRADVLRQAKRDIESTGTKIIRQISASVGAAGLAQQKGIDTGLVISATPEGTAFDVIQGGVVTYSRVTASGLTIEQAQSEIARTLASAGVSSLACYSEINFSDPSHQIIPEGSTFQSIIDSLTDLDIRLPEYRVAQETKLVNSRRNLAALLLAATVCIGAMFYMDRDDLNIKIEKETRKWDKELEALESRKSLLAPRLTSAEAQSKLVDNLMKPKQHPSDVAQTVSNLVTEGVWLTGISFERGRAISIRGTAKNQNQVADYVTSLSSSDRLRDVTLSFANDTKIEETNVTQFSISAHVVGNFPLEDAKKNTSRR